MQLSLTTLDKQFLFGKYIREGATPDEADFRIKNVLLHLKEIINKLKTKETSKQDIQRIFMEEFVKMRNSY